MLSSIFMNLQTKRTNNEVSNEATEIRASTEYHRTKVYSDDEKSSTFNVHFDHTELKEEVQFNDMLRNQVGEFNTHQAILICLGFIRSMLVCCHTLTPVFIVATPDHWCDVTNLTQYSCSQRYLKDVLIPKEERQGLTVPSQCKYYSVGAILSDEFVNITKDCLTVFNHSNDDLQIESCDKWIYDTQYYTSTVVNEVSSFEGWPILVKRIFKLIHLMTWISFGREEPSSDYPPPPPPRNQHLFIRLQCN